MLRTIEKAIVDSKHEAGLTSPLHLPGTILRFGG